MTLNHTNYLREFRRLVPQSAIAVGNLGTSSLNAPDPCAHLTDASHRVPRWSLLCNGNPFVRDCPSLSSAKSWLRRETGRDKDLSKSSVPRSLTANEPSSAFKRDGNAVLPVSVKHAKFPVQIIDPAMPSMTEKSTVKTFQMQIFFVLGAVQTLAVLILADSGSVRNLIDKSVYRRLLYLAHDTRLRKCARNRWLQNKLSF